jgi:DNA-binding beta-propeller fold protein YncE
LTGKSGKNIFVAIPRLAQTQVIDAKKRQVAASWNMNSNRKENALIPMSFRSATTISMLGICMLASAQNPSSKNAAGKSNKPIRKVSTLLLQEQIVVPNVTGRLDHFTADAKRKRLIVSALGNNSIEVIDVFTGRAMQSITGVSEPQGSLYIPEFDKLFVAGAGDGKVHIFDGATYALRSSIDIGADPDNLRYDAVSKQVYVGFGEEDGGITAIDPVTEKRTGEAFKTGGHPESFQLETSGQHIFVNVPDQGSVVESIDRKTGAVTKWPLTGLHANYALALDEEDHRLFTVTRKTPTLVVLDTNTGKEITRMRVAGECDDVYFDAARKRIYVIGAEGFISVVEQKDANHYELLENVPSSIGVRTGYFFTKRDRFYVGMPAKGSEPAQIWTYGAED